MIKNCIKPNNEKTIPHPKLTCHARFLRELREKKEIDNSMQINVDNASRISNKSRDNSVYNCRIKTNPSKTHFLFS